MIEIVVVRHGETDWNVEKRMQGHLDIGLNATGLHQAAALGRALQGETFDAIFSSDLRRALHTALAIAAVPANRNLSVDVDINLRERCFGAFEGTSYAELETKDPVAHAAWKARDLDARYPAGARVAETLREFSVRALAAVNRLAQQARQKNARKIAIVTHGGVLECFYRAATHTSLQHVRDFPIPNAGINRLQWNADGLSIIDWANVDHLSTAASDKVGR